MAVVQGVNPDGTLADTSTYYNSTSSNKTSGSTMDKTAFLQLLVAEMQNQDPLEPQSNSEFVAQYASFSQVEALQNMQTTYDKTLASDLVGRPVIMKTESASGQTGYVCGIVDYAVNENGKVYLNINGSYYDIEDLDTVLEMDYYKKNVLNKDDTADKSDKTNTSDKTDTADKSDKTDTDSEKSDAAKKAEA